MEEKKKKKKKRGRRNRGRRNRRRRRREEKNEKEEEKKENKEKTQEKKNKKRTRGVVLPAGFFTRGVGSLMCYSCCQPQVARVTDVAGSLAAESVSC